MCNSTINMAVEFQVGKFKYTIVCNEHEGVEILKINIENDEDKYMWDSEITFNKLTKKYNFDIGIQPKELFNIFKDYSQNTLEHLVINFLTNDSLHFVKKTYLNDSNTDMSNSMYDEGNTVYEEPIDNIVISIIQKMKYGTLDREFKIICEPIKLPTITRQGKQIRDVKINNAELAKKFSELEAEYDTLVDKFNDLYDFVNSDQFRGGKDGLPGKDGKDGLNGLNGKDGVNGKDGAPGKAGLNGKDGKDFVPVVKAPEPVTTTPAPTTTATPVTTTPVTPTPPV